METTREACASCLSDGVRSESVTVHLLGDYWGNGQCFACGTCEQGIRRQVLVLESPSARVCDGCGDNPARDTWEIIYDDGTEWSSLCDACAGLVACDGSVSVATRL